MRVRILRGARKSGKTSYIRSVMSSNDVVVSDADNDSSTCFISYLEYLEDFDTLSAKNKGEERTIYVDNPNIEFWQLYPYLLAAEGYGVTNIEVVHTLIGDNTEISSLLRCEVPRKYVGRMSRANGKSVGHGVLSISTSTKNTAVYKNACGRNVSVSMLLETEAEAHIACGRYAGVYVGRMYEHVSGELHSNSLSLDSGR